jgi:hypothetical protein
MLVCGVGSIQGMTIDTPCNCMHFHAHITTPASVEATKSLVKHVVYSGWIAVVHILFTQGLTICRVSYDSINDDFARCFALTQLGRPIIIQGGAPSSSSWAARLQAGSG